MRRKLLREGIKSHSNKKLDPKKKKKRLLTSNMRWRKGMPVEESEIPVPSKPIMVGHEWCENYIYIIFNALIRSLY
jgi:hypothetical protein